MGAATPPQLAPMKVNTPMARSGWAPYNKMSKIN